MSTPGQTRRNWNAANARKANEPFTWEAISASFPKCPECGATMRPTGRGATLAKHGRQWVCPVAEAEVTKDERGHLHRCADAKHAYTRVWSEDELPARK